MDRLLSMQVFQKVVDEGGFAAAARALNMSPAATTRLVADLESHLGTRLLHRTTRRVSLTVAGEAYLGRVRAILESIEDAHRIAGSQSQEMAGVLRIQTRPVLATYILAPLIPDFLATYPEIQLKIEVGSVDGLVFEDFDLTLFPADDSYNGDVVARKVSTTDSILVCSPAYVEKQGVPRAPGDLSNHRVLCWGASGRNDERLQLTDPERKEEAVEVSIKPTLWANHTETLLLAALNGAGITSVPLVLAYPYLSRGGLVRILEPWITGRLNIYAALPSRKFLPRRTRCFLDYLVDWVQRRKHVVSQSHEHNALLADRYLGAGCR